jgi:hypothetical protein
MSISKWNQGFFSTSIFGYKIFGKLSPPPPPKKNKQNLLVQLALRMAILFGLNWEFKVE